MKENKILEEKNMEVINLGIIDFYDSVVRQSVPCIQVDWRPPAGGDVRLIEIIDKLKKRG